MPVAVTRVTFSEDNDARPTYVTAAIGAIILLLHRLLNHAHPNERGLYFAGVCVSGLACIFAINCLMGCIWHPIPKDRRGDAEMTLLHLNRPAKEPLEHHSAILSQLDDQVDNDQDEVDASQVELRDPIQWTKLAFTLLAIGVDLSLTLLWSQ